MHNVIILGSGRSGTSMVAGTLAKAGYFMGENLYPPRESNPKGFFENAEVNGINEALLAQVILRRPLIIPQRLRKIFFRRRPIRGQRWLARVPVGTYILVPSSIEERIRNLTQRTPYCFKDPRFSYTLPAWLPALENTVFVCIFRDPATTVASILKECKNAQYLHSLSINKEQAIQVWTLMYRHILEVHHHHGEWLFLHFDQVLEKTGIDKLADFIHARVDYSFPDAKLKRSHGTTDCFGETWDCYLKLCKLANYDIQR